MYCVCERCGGWAGGWEDVPKEDCIDESFTHSGFHGKGGEALAQDCEVFVWLDCTCVWLKE